MIFKKTYQSIIILSIIFFVGCIGIEREWEELDSNYDHVLNVFGILNLDPGFPSFIGLYRTTNLNEVSQQFSSVDTLFYCDCTNQGDDEDEKDERCWCDDGESYWVVDSIYEPAAVIKNASVIVSDEIGNSYELTFIENIKMIDTIYFDTTFSIYGYTVDWDTTIFDTNNIRLNFYIDTTGTFNPQPNTYYSLSVISDGFDPLSGSLITPSIPNFDSIIQRGEVVDTIIVNEPFDIQWTPQQSGRGMVTGEVILGDWWNDTSSSDWCGGDFDPFIIDLYDEEQNQYSIYPWLCFEENDNNEAKDYVLRLTAMDDNYYEYFITGEAGEYSNALLNYPTTKGRSVGVEGGFGLFGSIASDWVVLKISR